MLRRAQMKSYKAFGLQIISEIPLPELIPAQCIGDADVEVIIGELSEQWLQANGRANKFMVQGKQVLFQVPDVATFAICGGTTIIISPLAKVQDDVIRLYVLGSCMGILLMQRKVYPLHGSAIAINGRAYAIIGESGAGKSTLAAAFLHNGCKLLSDDVIATSLSVQDGKPLVTPAYPQQKLWDRSMEAFGLNAGEYRSVYGRETKYCIPVSTQYANTVLPLSGAIELVKTDGGEVRISRIHSLHKLRTLFSHTYRNFLVPRMGLTDWHFKFSASIANHIDMWQVRRPDQGFTAQHIAARILEQLESKEVMV